MNARRVAALFSALRAANPHPKTELVFATPFQLLVAVILSAQATDKSVNKATAGLYRAARTPAAMLALGEAGLKEHIKSIGLFNTKADTHAACSWYKRDDRGILKQTLVGKNAWFRL